MLTRSRQNMHTATRLRLLDAVRFDFQAKEDGAAPTALMRFLDKHRPRRDGDAISGDDHDRDFEPLRRSGPRRAAPRGRQGGPLADPSPARGGRARARAARRPRARGLLHVLVAGCAGERMDGARAPSSRPRRSRRWRARSRRGRERGGARPLVRRDAADLGGLVPERGGRHSLRRLGAASARLPRSTGPRSSTRATGAPAAATPPRPRRSARTRRGCATVTAGSAPRGKRGRHIKRARGSIAQAASPRGCARGTPVSWRSARGWPARWRRSRSRRSGREYRMTSTASPLAGCPRGVAARREIFHAVSAGLCAPRHGRVCRPPNNRGAGAVLRVVAHDVAPHPRVLRGAVVESRPH